MVEKDWSLLDSKLVKHCISLGVDKIWENICREESFDLMCNDYRRDVFNFVLYKSKIIDAGTGLFAISDIPSETNIGLQFSAYANDIEKLVLPKPLTANNLEKAVEKYEKSIDKCNTKYVLHKEIKKPFNHFFFVQTIKKIQKSEELYIHYYPEQWIVAEYLQPFINPCQKFTLDELDLLENTCIKCIGDSRKRATIIYSIYCNNLRRTPKVKTLTSSIPTIIEDYF